MLRRAGRTPADFCCDISLSTIRWVGFKTWAPHDNVQQLQASNLNTQSRDHIADPSHSSATSLQAKERRRRRRDANRTLRSAVIDIWGAATQPYFGADADARSESGSASTTTSSSSFKKADKTFWKWLLRSCNNNEKQARRVLRAWGKWGGSGTSSAANDTQSSTRSFFGSNFEFRYSSGGGSFASSAFSGSSDSGGGGWQDAYETTWPYGTGRQYQQEEQRRQAGHTHPRFKQEQERQQQQQQQQQYQQQERSNFGSAVYRNEVCASLVVLGLGAGALPSAAELKTAFRKRAMQFHPDRHRSGTAEALAAAEAQFKEAQAAFQMLQPLVSTK